jgi:hypothetical protein
MKLVKKVVWISNRLRLGLQNGLLYLASRLGTVPCKCCKARHEENLASWNRLDQQSQEYLVAIGAVDVEGRSIYDAWLCAYCHG